MELIKLEVPLHQPIGFSFSEHQFAIKTTINLNKKTNHF